MLRAGVAVGGLTRGVLIRHGNEEVIMDEWQRRQGNERYLRVVRVMSGEVGCKLGQPQ